MQVKLDECFPCKWAMGKDQELLEAARSGNVTVVEKILGQRAKRSGPLARWVSPEKEFNYFARFLVSSARFFICSYSWLFPICLG